MQIYEIVMIGVALAMDAFAVTISNCTVYRESLTPAKKWAMPATFALFQFAMPVIGYFIGGTFASYISGVAGYLTSAVFFLLSVKVLVDVILEKKSPEKPKKPSLSLGALILQGVATSIDALFIGVTFSAELSFSVFYAAAIVGVTTFIIVSVALLLGKGVGKLLKDLSSLFGVLILLALAIVNLIKALA